MGAGGNGHGLGNPDRHRDRRRHGSHVLRVGRGRGPSIGPGRRTPSRSEPRALVLGAAAGGGFPQWNCRCAVCALAWQGDSRVTPRTQSSLAVTADGDAWVIVNASPDLREQVRALPDLWPRTEPRHSPIAAVVLTSAEVDHVAGLLHLRERQPFRLIALEPVHAALDQTAIFGVLGRDVVARVVAQDREPLTVAPDLS